MAAEPSWDRIHIRDLLLRCVVGANELERIGKQDVLINITLYGDLRGACRSDDIDQTIDYSAVKKRVMSVVEDSTCALIECLAERIANACLEDMKVQQVTVSVEKPGALRFARTVAVEIERRREG